MQTYIVLLRGINVSGQKRIIMAELRELLTSKGFLDVQTYIQSGNIILSSNKTSTECEQIIFDAILEHYSFEVPILVKTASEIKEIMGNCPFPIAKKEKSIFNLLQAIPSEESIEKTNLLSFPFEEFYITSSCVYFYCEKGYARVKMTNSVIERKLKVRATGRNFNTMTKLLALCPD